MLGHSYQTLLSQDAFELRDYPQILVAKVLVAGPFEDAFKRGSEILESYLQGDNYKKEKLQGKIPFRLTSRPDGWEVSCILPPYHTRETAPKPISEKIRFEHLKPRKVAVLRFQGKTRYAGMMKKIEELKCWAKSTEMKMESSSHIVVYTPQYLPFLRRNEIQIDGV